MRKELKDKLAELVTAKPQTVEQAAQQPESTPVEAKSKASYTAEAIGISKDVNNNWYFTKIKYNPSTMEIDSTIDLTPQEDKNLAIETFKLYAARNVL